LQDGSKTSERGAERLPAEMAAGAEARGRRRRRRRRRRRKRNN
jgi:hypothetical protein